MSSPRDDRWLDGDDTPTLAHIFLRTQGRLPRQAYWLYGVAVPLGVGLLLYALLGIAGLQPEVAEGVANVVLLWPALAVSIKRWHDRDKSAWWVLVALVPVVGWLWMLIDNGCLRGTVGPNRFGPDPLATPGSAVQ